MVGINQLSGGGDHAYSVAIAIKGKPNVSARFLHLAHQVLHVFRLARIRVVIGKVAIDLIEQRSRINAEAG